MLTFRPAHKLFDRAPSAVRGLAGIFLLLLQLLGPALASPGDSMWIEICSEAGAVWVEVDLEEGTEDPTAPCPKCAECTLCALTSAAPVPEALEATRTGFVRFVHIENGTSFELYNSNWLWPETRGPPCPTQNVTERTLRASNASTLNIGGAPWS